MAELSDADKKVLLGAGYKAPVVTQASRDKERAEKLKSLRNVAIGIAVLVAIVFVASFFRT